MNTESQSALIPRISYRAVAGQTVPVAIERVTNNPQPASGELIDISESGARILSDSPLRFGEKLVLHLESNPIGVTIAVGCQVQWIRSGVDEGQWTVGCLFEYYLEKELLEKYVDDTLLERRQSDRHRISLPVSVKFEGVGDDWVKVDLYDMGAGGFCFQSPTEATIGTRVCMTLDDSSYDTVQARIMWEFADDGKHLIGCQWTNRRGIFFATELLQSTVLRPKRKRLRLGNNLVGTLVITLVAFSFGLFFASFN